MLAHGNGNPEVCALNLLRTVRGEVPYDRIKGVNGALIDDPATLAFGEVKSDALWVLRNYEPRVIPESIDISGAYELTARINKRGESSDAR